MKRSTKSLLKGALVTGVIGCGFCIAGLCLGFTLGEFGAAVEAGRFQLIGPDGLGEKIRTAVTDTVNDSIEYEKTMDEAVKALDLDLGVGDCYIHIYDGDQWKVTGSNLPASFKCRMSDHHTLNIDCENNGWKFWEQNNGSILNIYVPKHHELEKVDIECGVGNVRTEGGMLICEELDLDGGVGDSDLWLDFSEKVDVDGGVGNVNLTLAASKNDYDFDVDGGVGEITIGSLHINELGGSRKIDNDANREVVVDCGVGNITILFEE